MFNTMQVARTIREARIAKNMTQMNLADAMEVSYQAVSNWERGNSMPDISKLEQLCQVLDIKIERLLGGNTSQAVTKAMGSTPAIIKTVYKENVNRSVPDNAPDPSAAVQSAAVQSSPADGTPETESMTVEEICDIAPLLPPSDIEALVDNNMQQTKEQIDFSAIAALAPFLDSEYLERLVQDANIGSLREIVSIAPFLSTKTLDALVLSSDPECDMHGIISIAPFLSSAALNTLALDKIQGGSLKQLAGLAPFLSSETLDALVERTDPNCDMSGIVSLAPFLSGKTLDSLALDKIQGGSLKQLAGLAPFLSSETLDALVERTDPECDMHGIAALAPFLGSATLNRLAVKAISRDMSGSEMSCLFPFLSQDTLQQIAEALMRKKDLAALKNLAPFI